MRPPRVKMKLSPPLAAVTALLIAVAMTESAADPGEAAPFLVLPLMNGLEYKRTPGRTMLLFAYSEDDLYHQHMLTDSWSLEVNAWDIQGMCDTKNANFGGPMCLQGVCSGHGDKDLDAALHDCRRF